MAKKILSICLVLFLAGTVFGAEKKTNDTPAPGNSLGLDAVIGAANIAGVTYTQILLKPELDFGGWGIGLDINLELDQSGALRPGEWDSWQAVINKIRHFWVGSKGKNFYLRVGRLDKVSIGHGTIMDGFSNNLFYPDIVMSGVQLDIDFGVFGFESFVDNFLDWDILAGRIYLRPLASSGGLLKGLEFGATYVHDFDNLNPVYPDNSQKNKYEYGDNSSSLANVAVYGFDAALPLPSLGVLTWTVFADYVAIKNKGTGIMAGVYGKLLGLLNWRIEYQQFQGRFTAPYFDNFYLADRAGKYDYLDSLTRAYSGTRLSIWRSFSIVKRNDLSLRLEVTANQEERPMLFFEFLVDRKLLFDRLEMSLTYTKKNISDFRSAFTIEGLDTIIEWKFGFMIAKNVMLATVYTKTFVQDPTTSALVGQESTAVQTQLKF